MILFIENRVLCFIMIFVFIDSDCLFFSFEKLKWFLDFEVIIIVIVFVLCLKFW